jgi:predicted neuraminidase
MRTACGCLLRTDSKDGGKTWGPARRTDLPNNNSGIDALGLEDGRLLLVYNPVGRNWGKRTPLTLAVSGDHGKHWKNLVHLETEAGEYSYPAIVRTTSGVAVSYTWKRERIRCWQIPLDALKQAGMR